MKKFYLFFILFIIGLAVKAQYYGYSLDYIVIDDSLYRETEQVELVGDPNKARKEMGWSCLIDFRQLVHMMVDEDMRLLLQ